MTSGLQRRLLLLLLTPLLMLAVLNTWFDFRSADSAARQQDRQLLALAPLLADSIIAGDETLADPPLLLMAPPIDEFLVLRPGRSAFAVLDTDGQVLVGDPWLSGPPPATPDAEFSSEEFEGTTYRIVSQRFHSVAGDVVVRLADGSDPRQQWLAQLAVKVLLPNFVLAIAGFFAVNWAVRTALRPLLELRDAVERRSPRDLSALDPEASPDEVRPLVLSLNRLFVLVNAQAESQSRFVADAAHQLRTPLAGLQAQVEAWAQAVSPPKGMQPMPAGHTDSGQRAITLEADQILRLRHAARRTSQLANQLLALSRADARSAHNQPVQHVNLQQLCEGVLESLLDTATARQIDLGLEVEPAHIQGQTWLLRELLVNLADNAIKYTPPGGRVTLRSGLRATSGKLAPQAFLEVEDDGPGIPAAETVRVLERFYRVPGTAIEGNGLGLAIADEIARVHGSHLEMSPGAHGRGLRVWLVLAA
jgi:two-component system, OmpR family, sensor histidine kinase TctE